MSVHTNMPLRPALHFALVVLLACANSGRSCTIIGVGKDASASGYPMVGHSDDSGPSASDFRLIRVPRKQWPQGSLRPLFNWKSGYPRVVSAAISPEYAPVAEQQETEPIGHIPQVPQTWAYWDTDYGVQNEVGLSIGESTCTARTVGWPADKPYGYNRAGIEDLSKIAMERCTTARCAVQVMGQVAVEQGFYSADSGEPAAPGYVDSSECLAVADATLGELWVFNVLTGKGNASAIWAAQRVPSDHVVAVGNSFTIRKMNLSDGENFMYSSGVTQLAEEMGWWNPKNEASPGIFDFFGAYGYAPSPADSSPGAQHLRNVLKFYSGRRMWRIFSLLSPAEGAKLDPNKGNVPDTQDPYPGSVPAPKNSVTLQMVLDVYRDHYEGTPYDLTQGMAAGPHGNPNRGPVPPHVVGIWERAISMHRTTFSFVCVARPVGRSVVWFGLDSPHGTAYLPFYGAASSGAPESYHSHDGYQSKFSTKVAWWAFNLVNQYQDTNFRAINGDVRHRAHETESKASSLVSSWEKEADAMSTSEASLALLTARSNAFAEEVVAGWWEFSGTLFAKYGRYVVTFNESETGESFANQTYPEWWVLSPEVGFATWAPQGPFHGIMLTENGTAAMAAAASLPATWMAGINIPIVFVIWLLPSVSMAGIAYHMGTRRGRESHEIHQGYIYYP